VVTTQVTDIGYFQNEVLATGFDLPTNLEFLPDGRMLVAELQGKVKILSPPYTPSRQQPLGAPARDPGQTGVGMTT